MFRHAAARLLPRSASLRRFSTDLPAATVGDEAFESLWRKTIPNIEPPRTPLSNMKPRPPIPSAIPSKLTVNFVLPYASEIANKEVDMIIVPATTGQMGILRDSQFSSHSLHLDPRPKFRMFLRRSLSGTVDSIGKSNICSIVSSSLRGRFGVISSFEKVNQSIPLSFKNFIHSGDAKEFEARGDFRSNNSGRSFFDGNAAPRNANFGNGISNADPNVNNVRDFGRANFGRSFMGANGFNASDGFSFPQVNIEKDGDIVHIKMLKNNCFITVTDANGNKKFGSTTGIAEKGTGRIPRYSADAVAEQIGREARERGIKSVVVKINGYTFFTKKKKAILSFREGYSHSRLDKNPIVYVEDTTRRAHNGCRLRKKRRF